MNETTLELSDKYLETRRIKEMYEEHLQQAKTECDELERELIDAMVNDELSSFKRNDIQFSLVNKSYTSAEPERKDELWQAMKVHGFEELFTINSNTLAAQVKRLTEDNEGELPTWLDGLIKQYEKPSIRIKK